MRPSLISPPAVYHYPLSFEAQSWLSWDAANPRIERRVQAINEHAARVAGGILFSRPAWRIRVRPALQSLEIA